MCRACRFQKCERLGMNKNSKKRIIFLIFFVVIGIQLKREPLGSRIIKSPGLASSASSPGSSSESLLDLALRGYQEYLEQQKMLYYMNYPEHMFADDIVWVAPSVVGFMQYERSCIPLHYQMLKKYFPPFDQLQKVEQVC